MTLLNRIQSELKTAQKAKNQLVVDTLRILLAEIHNKKIEQQGELKDEQIVFLVQREVKKRKEAIVLYQRGNRPELVKKESDEMNILSKYLPQQMSPKELTKIVTEIIRNTKAKSPADFGRVMGLVMGRVKGKADGKQVSIEVKKQLE